MSICNYIYKERYVSLSRKSTCSYFFFFLFDPFFLSFLGSLFLVYFEIFLFHFCSLVAFFPGNCPDGQNHLPHPEIHLTVRVIYLPTGLNKSPLPRCRALFTDNTRTKFPKYQLN